MRMAPGGQPARGFPTPASAGLCRDRPTGTRTPARGAARGARAGTPRAPRRGVGRAGTTRASAERTTGRRSRDPDRARCVRAARTSRDRFLSYPRTEVPAYAARGEHRNRRGAGACASPHRDASAWHPGMPRTLPAAATWPRKAINKSAWLQKKLTTKYCRVRKIPLPPDRTSRQIFAIKQYRCCRMPESPWGCRWLFDREVTVRTRSDLTDMLHVTHGP